MNDYYENFLGIIRKQNPTRIALISSDRTWTFGELTQRSTQWLNVLSGNIGRGEIVACDYEENPLEFVAKFIGVMAAGGVHLSTRDSTRTWSRLDSLGAPWSAITTSPVSATIGSSFLRSMVDLSGTVVHGKASTYDQTIDLAGRILETSGSTGEPKWVFWSERALIADRQGWIHELSLSERDVILNLHSLDFAHGIDVHVLSGLMVGAPVIHRSIRSDDVTHIVADIARYKVTMMSALPSHYTTIANACQNPETGASVRWALTGGALLSPATISVVRRKVGMNLKRLYGATEAGIMCADLVTLDQSTPSLRPLADVSMQIRPLPGNVSDVFPNVGEPYFQRTDMAAKYWGDELRTEKVFSDGWYKSGDAVILNSDGSVAVLGRAEDVWINPSSKALISCGELSASLSEIEGVSEVAIIPPPSANQAVPTIFCTVTPNSNFGHIRQGVEEKIKEFEIEATIYLSNDWPRTVVGKPERRALMAWSQG